MVSVVQYIQGEADGEQEGPKNMTQDSESTRTDGLTSADTGVVPWASLSSLGLHSLWTLDSYLLQGGAAEIPDFCPSLYLCSG